MFYRLDLSRQLDVASEAAAAAAGLLQNWQQDQLDIQEKRPGDLVTDADTKAETLILTILNRHFPSDPVLTEETGWHGLDQGEFCWVVDPIDGTTNFTHGYPFASVSIGLLYQQHPVLGVVYDLFHHRLFQASHGQGATCNRRPIRVSASPTLAQSLLVTGFAYDRREVEDNNYAEFCHFTHLTQGVRRGGSAALDLAFVATGQLDGYWERGLSPWDIAAGIVLVQEAGGQVSAYDGSPVDIFSGRVLATNGHLHAQMQTELAQVRPLGQAFPMRCSSSEAQP
ncbi:MAG: inositol monophosphatase [Synechococcaceae cyanobacterium SM2_3_1]|nr:inositol monophosphatase [Synechococcaceae cyanobacterium SM2_3_1]